MHEYVFKMKKGDIEIELKSDDLEFVEEQLNKWREELLQDKKETEERIKREAELARQEAEERAKREAEELAKKKEEVRKAAEALKEAKEKAEREILLKRVVIGIGVCGCLVALMIVLRRRRNH